jgi:hypothetical protein
MSEFVSIGKVCLDFSHLSDFAGRKAKEGKNFVKAESECDFSPEVPSLFFAICFHHSRRNESIRSDDAVLSKFCRYDHIAIDYLFLYFNF